jgi:hypothetical protein
LSKINIDNEQVTKIYTKLIITVSKYFSDWPRYIIFNIDDGNKIVRLSGTNDIVRPVIIINAIFRIIDNITVRPITESRKIIDSIAI